MMADREVCGIIVTYNPDGSVLDNLRALLLEVEHVVVVDNASAGPSKEYVEQAGGVSRTTLVGNRENLGVAGGLNIGVKHALGRGFHWIATFDQDSTVTPGMISRMRDAYNAFPEKERVAIISPRHQDKTTGTIASAAGANPPRENLLYEPVLATITSGNLVKSSIFQSVGYFNEDLFIDYVDHEFCLRCAMRGYVILEAQQAVLHHSQGNPTPRRFLWKRRVVLSYNASRLYYKSRNRIHLWKRFRSHYPKWVTCDMRAAAREFLELILLEPNRVRKTYAVMRGAYHGLMGRLGKD